MNLPLDCVTPGLVFPKSHPEAGLLRTKRSGDSYKLCGDQLIRMMTLVCGIYMHMDLARFKAINSQSWSTLHSRKKRSRGLSDYCCQSSCSLKQLEQACSEHGKWGPSCSNMKILSVPVIGIQLCTFKFNSVLYSVIFSPIYSIAYCRLED